MTGGRRFIGSFFSLVPPMTVAASLEVTVLGFGVRGGRPDVGARLGIHPPYRVPLVGAVPRSADPLSRVLVISKGDGLTPPLTVAAVEGATGGMAKPLRAGAFGVMALERLRLR
jgi:hypothetical protein